MSKPHFNMKPLPGVLNGVRIIKDLGVDYLNEKSRTKTRNAVIECPSCKEQRIVNVYAIRNGQNNGWCPSCANTGKNNGMYKHGESYTSKGKNTRTHRIWNNMKSRCLNPNNKDYPKYGGRGVRVCKEWMGYENFKQWADDRLVDEMTIERLDVHGDYSPDNCVIVPHWVQAYNRRNSLKGGILTYIAIAKDLDEIPPYHGKVKFIAKKYGVDRMVVSHLNEKRGKKETLLKLDRENPEWLQEYRRRMNELAT